MIRFIKQVFLWFKGIVMFNLKLTILALVALSAIFTYISIEMLHFTSDPGFCQKCHPNEAPGPLGEVYTWNMSAHAKANVLCLDCHGAPGFIGYMKAKIGGLYDVYNEFLGTPEHKLWILQQSADVSHAAKLVPNRTCLFCHSDSGNAEVRKDTFFLSFVTGRKLDKAVNPEFRKKYDLPDILVDPTKPDANIETNHKKHNDMGLSCLECHHGITHSGKTGYISDMQLCFTCHDTMRAKAKNPPGNENCKACHLKDEGMIPKKPIAFGQGKGAVSFDHTTHTAMAQCGECHTKLFAYQKGSSKIGFPDHGSNKYCFNCHNGKKATSWTECATCHAEIPSPTAPIVYKMKDAEPVEFSHDFHGGVFACKDCHPKLWPMKRGPKKMKMDPMYEGKYCGACHNGKDAFAATDCDKCHIEPKK